MKTVSDSDPGVEPKAITARTGGGRKLEAILNRESDARAALKEIQRRRRAQEKDDRDRAVAEIGTAMIADAESSGDPARRAYISEVLDRVVTNENTRAFLRSKNWLAS